MTTLGTFVPPAAPGVPAAGGGWLPEVRADLLDAIHAKHRNGARSLQTAIGPSQAGHPCPRHLLFMATGHDRTQSFVDPWPSILGTAGHSWLAEALDAQPAGTWLSERRVDVGAGLSGRSDAFHIPHGAVVDFKILGNTKFHEIANKPSDDPYWTTGDGVQYFKQIQSYGTGMANQGYPVRNVALAIFGRSKRLSDLFMVSWPYDPTVSAAVLSRLASVKTLAAAGVHPMAVPAVKTKSGCYYCPFRGTEAQGLCEEGEN